MTILYDKNSIEWDLHIPALLFAYRVTINETTGYSPAFLLYGRQPDTPTDILFDASALRGASFSSHKDYAHHIRSSLKSAFDIARKAQEKHGLTNVQRLNKSRTDAPLFEVDKDSVYYWTNSAAEHRVQTGEGNQYAPLRDKWGYWWQGPYKVVARNGNRHYTISVNGKSVKANVNRLTRAHQWSPQNPDTSKWTTNISAPANAPSFVQHNERSTRREAGHIIIFTTEISDMHPCPFGIARLLHKPEHNEPVCAQWYGNIHNRPNSTYKPCWYAKATHQYYYAPKPERRSKQHVPYTFYMTNTKITESDILFSGYSILDSNDRIKKHIWQQLIEHPQIAKRMPQHAIK